MSVTPGVGLQDHESSTCQHSACSSSPLLLHVALRAHQSSLLASPAALSAASGQRRLLGGSKGQAKPRRTRRRTCRNESVSCFAATLASALHRVPWAAMPRLLASSVSAFNWARALSAAATRDSLHSTSASAAVIYEVNDSHNSSLRARAPSTAQMSSPVSVMRLLQGGCVHQVQITF